MKNVLLFWVLLLSACFVLAQDEGLTVEEYIERVELLSFDLSDPDNIVSTILTEFTLRYGDTATIAQKSQMYEKFIEYGFRAYAVAYPILDEAAWNFAILKQYFRENSIDLNQKSFFEFDVYTLESNPIQLTAEERGWLLTLRRNENDFVAYYSAIRNEESLTSYTIAKLPLPFDSWNYTSYQQEGVPEYLYDQGDFNGNGAIELVYGSSIRIPASWITSNTNLYYFLEWQGSQFVESIPTLDSVSQYRTLQSQQTDTSTALEWIFTEIDVDNWYCRHGRKTLYSWNATEYRKETVKEAYSSSMGCAMRRAETAMQEGDYQTAASAYTEALDFYQRGIPETDALQAASFTADDLAAYAEERRAIAWLMRGEMELVQSQIAQWRTSETILKDSIADKLVNATSNNSFELCEAARSAIGRDSYRGMWALGFTDDLSFAYYPKTPFFLSPESVACPLSRMVYTTFTNHTFKIERNLIEQLADLRIEEEQLAYFNSDLNEDGAEDWLVRIIPYNQVWSFVSDENTYRVEEVPYNESGDLEERLTEGSVRLPDGTLAWIRYTDRIDYIHGCKYADGETVMDVPVYRVYITRILDQLLKSWSVGNVCQNPTDLQLPSFESLIDVNGDVLTWASGAAQRISGDKMVWIAEPARFSWMGDGEYVLQLSQSPDEASTRFVYDYGAFNEARYEDFVEDFKDELTQFSPEDIPDEFRYLYALSLDLLGRSNEAQEAFRTLSRIGTNMDWRALADIHLTGNE